MVLTAFLLVSFLPFAVKALRTFVYALHTLIVLLIAGAVDYSQGSFDPFTLHSLLMALGLHLASINILTFYLYKYDKKAARARSWRVPERMLHAFMVVGGSLGAVVGQYYYRHKTKKLSFRVWFILILLVQIGLVGGILSQFWM